MFVVVDDVAWVMILQRDEASRRRTIVDMAKHTAGFVIFATITLYETTVSRDSIFELHVCNT